MFGINPLYIKWNPLIIHSKYIQIYIYIDMENGIDMLLNGMNIYIYYIILYYIILYYIILYIYIYYIYIYYFTFQHIMGICG